MEKENQGKVWLVGAGPGDAGLFTLKGKRVLSEAQVVVYDSLVGDGVLSMVPKEARCIYVGKRAGNHAVSQEGINQILLEEAQKGYRVVRLKGGDPFLFGRGGEELELLVEHKIPFEIVPGISSPFAVPAYNGIPVTHRDYCSSVHVITGHKRAGAEYDIDFEALVRTGGTLIFLMGVAALNDICEHLIQAGMEPEMPAAILQQGTTAGQKRIVATVATLPQEVERQGIETPAIIIVGKVCETATDFAWYEKLPLAGCKVLVTRPKELISQMSGRLRRLGAEVLELPAICIRPVKDREEIHQAMTQIKNYDWLAFTSPSGVRIFFDELMPEVKMDMRKLGHLKIAALGSGTARELKKRGLYPDLMPEYFDGEALGKAMAEQCETNANILLPRAAMGTEDVIRALGAREDLDVTDLPIYDTFYEASGLIDEKREFASGKINLAVFTSASTVRGFAQAVQGLDFHKVTAACIGKQTKAAADALGMKTYMAKEATMEALTELVVELASVDKQI